MSFSGLITLVSLLCLLVPVADSATQDTHPDSAEKANKTDVGLWSAQDSPGTVLGLTWYDEMNRGSQGRRIAVGTGTRQLLHNTWTLRQDPEGPTRGVAYRAYDFAAASFTPEMLVYSLSFVTGYAALDLTPDNRAIILSHVLSVTAPNGLAQPILAWDQSEGDGTFGEPVFIPETHLREGGASWPRWGFPNLAVSNGPTDTVIHVVTHDALSDDEAARSLIYVRRIGSEWDTTAYWEYPPLVVDSTPNYSQQVIANDDGRVVILWVGNVPCPEDADTVSGQDCAELTAFDCDLYYRESFDYGATWQPTVNLSRHTRGGLEDFRAVHEVVAMFDHNDVLHIVWPATVWPQERRAMDTLGITAGAIFHWSEATGEISMVHDAIWNQTICSQGYTGLNVRDLSISECRSNFYVTFTQFNDAPAGVLDDCAAEYTQSFPVGSANGDIYVSISADGGLTWDMARNLTQTRTPGCDSTDGPGGSCASEVYPTIIGNGTDIGAGDGSVPAEIVIPPGGNDPGWYLDMQYLLDFAAGRSDSWEGVYSLSEVRWFRLACSDPVFTPQLTVYPDSVSVPVSIGHCDELTVPVILTNTGNAVATYNVAVQEDTGPAGWLQTISFDGSVSTAPEFVDTAYIIINAGGIVCSPGTMTRLTGRVRLDSNTPDSPHTIEIDVIVADTLYETDFDTVSTACLSLAAGNNGSFGQEGAGRVNLDYIGAGDCDMSANIYLYDGSPIIVTAGAVDTTIGWSIYGTDYFDPHGLVQLDSGQTSYDGAHEIYSCRFLDPTLTVLLEQTWYLPQDSDSCRTVIQKTTATPYEGATPGAITLGLALDWDIPSDSGSQNGSGYFVESGAVYQQGAENDGAGCQDNDARFGCAAPLAVFLKTDTYAALYDDADIRFRGASTRSNHEYVDSNVSGFDPHDLITTIMDTGYTIYFSSHPDSQFVDLHTIVTPVQDYPLASGETLVVYTALTTVPNGTLDTLTGQLAAARAWYCDHLAPAAFGCSCCKNRGDVNGESGSTGAVNVSDLTYLIDFLFRGGPEAPCTEEADVAGNDGVNVTDLTYLVDFLFRGGPPPPDC